MNPNNNNTLIGRIPTSEKLKYDFKENASDAKKNFAQGLLAVRRNYKPKDEQYYPEDLIPFKAFGSSATFLGNYCQRGSTVALCGEIRKADNWENDKGELQYGQLYFHVDGVTKLADPKGSDEESGGSAKPAAAAKAASPAKKANPLLNKRRSVI